MNERAILVVLVCLPLFSGRCGDEKHGVDARDVDGPPAAEVVVRGEVHYEERVLFPQGATLRVVAEVAGEVIGEDVREIVGSPPHAFAISIDEAANEDLHDAVLRAEIRSSTGHAFASDEPLDAFEDGRPRVDVELLVQPAHD